MKLENQYAGFYPTYHIQMLSKETIKINSEGFKKSIQNYFNDVQFQDNLENNLFHLSVSDYFIYFKEGRMPSQLVLMNSDSEKEIVVDEDSLHQSWTLNNIRSNIHQYTQWSLFTDLMCSNLNYKDRHQLLKKGIISLLENSNIDILYWHPTHQLVDAKKVLLNFKEGSNEFNELFGFINIRFYNIENTEGEMIMDSLGLAALGLPDIQIHFKNLQAQLVADCMYNIACYIFENGDIIKNNETLQGISENDKWICRHEESLLKPKRIVLDINPGKEFVAGKRG